MKLGAVGQKRLLIGSYIRQISDFLLYTIDRIRKVCYNFVNLILSRDQKINMIGGM